MNGKALGLGLVLVMSAGLAYSLEGRTRELYLPGPTTAGHYQIELTCDSCHTSAFGDQQALQSACVRCHGAELAEANDSHPQRKFTDPRNASTIEQLDARYCVACHREHRPEVVSEMGLSLPSDYCYRCHQSIAEDRPSHKGMGFDTCAKGGCHNFHDNRALYEDFIEKHLSEPEVLPNGRSLARTFASEPTKTLTLTNADAPSNVNLSEAERSAWFVSQHARAGVNCSDCHVGTEPKSTVAILRPPDLVRSIGESRDSPPAEVSPFGDPAAVNSAGPTPRGTPSVFENRDRSFSAKWNDKVPDERCAKCHAAEQAGYRKGRHGMREAAGLEPLRVGEARLKMKESASDKTLGCTSCHGAHSFDTRKAAVDACMGCHDDDHTKNYAGSSHARLWLADETGQSGASCATCHLPRAAEGERVHVLHNQNDTLRPNEKMVRAVCMNCHGLGFSLAALADETLCTQNFSGKKPAPAQSLEMVRSRQMTH